MARVMVGSEAEMSRHEQLKQNAAAVEARVAAACERAGRPRSAVRVVVVSKYVGPAEVQALAALGYEDFGESRPQVLWEKAATFPRLRWHLVGHLQRNKIEKTLPIATLLHGVDSLRLLEALQAEAARQQRRARVLLEVHLSGEASKQGFAVEELPAAAAAAARLPEVDVLGLMTMAALGSDAEAARRTFAQLRELRDQGLRRGDLPPTCQELSMGMTSDLEPAIEEGATIVRVGSAFFHGLNSEPPS